MKLYNAGEIYTPPKRYRKTTELLATLATLGLLTFLASLVAILCISP